MSEIEKKYKITFSTNIVYVKAESESEALDIAFEYQIINNLSLEIIKIEIFKHLSSSKYFTNI